MKSYVQQLKLSFDPFEASTISREFFEGGNRKQIRDQIVERAMYSESLISVSGSLGSGKTSLLAAISQSFGEEAVVVNIVATLFMNPDQFMDQLVGALQLPGEFESIEDRAHAVTRLAGQLHMDARSLLIQVDDAHELSSEVLKHLVALKSGAAADSVHVILFGESQLGNVLENTLAQEQLANLAKFELDGFGSETTIEYVRFKLGSAGFIEQLPLTGSILGAIHNSSNGLPGAINALVRDALDEEFVADVEVVDIEAVETVDVETVGVEIDALENQFSADVAIEEHEYTENEREEFSAAREVEVTDTAAATSTATRYFVAAAILLIVFVAAIALFRPNQKAETAGARISVPVSPVTTAPATSRQVMPEEVSLSTIVQRPRASADLNPNATESELEAELEPEAAELLTPAAIVASPGQEAVPTESIASAAEEATEKVAEAVQAVALSSPEPVSESGPEQTTPLEVPDSASNAVSGAVVRTPEPAVRVSTSASATVSTADSTTASTTASAVASENTELSSFERALLSFPPSSYTVQIVGASSEANIQAFVAAAQLSVTAGYFETRLNGKPWYVVIAGNFPDRESATALISSLPDAAKASGPWVRSLASIQTDIQKLQ